MNTLKIEFDPNANELPEPLTDEFEGTATCSSQANWCVGLAQQEMVRET